MGEHTTISWTDHTFNCWIGCTRVSPGCDHCYAEELDNRWRKGVHWGKGAPRMVMSDAYWQQPLKWDRDAAKAGVRKMVFCASMADVMDDEAPEGQRERLWKLIDATPNLIWQLLTKRPQRYMTQLPPFGFLHDNVWLGTTAENQEFYDVRWPVLHAICNVRGLISWISYEPALGPVSMAKWSTVPHWIIFGGESGSGRRECKREWADALLAECRRDGVKFFVKQMGARTPADGKALIPVDLLIHEFPAGGIR